MARWFMFWDILWVIAAFAFAWVILKELITQFREFRRIGRTPEAPSQAPEQRSTQKEDDPAPHGPVKVA
ncbi:MAG: hypothetical protein ACREIS_10765 [Nitrospiraceae bacterium]